MGTHKSNILDARCAKPRRFGRKCKYERPLVLPTYGELPSYVVYLVPLSVVLKGESGVHILISLYALAGGSVGMLHDKKSNHQLGNS